MVSLGGGRRGDGDRIDPSVGLAELANLADDMNQGDVLARVDAADDEAWERAAKVVRQAYRLEAEGTVPQSPLVYDTIDGGAT